MTPLFPTPPTLEHPRGLLKVWLFDKQATIVDQVLSPVFSEEVASFLTTQVEVELRGRYSSRGRKVTFVHDWRGVTSYESKAREQLIDWGRAWLKDSEHVTVCISDKASPFVRIAAVTGVGALRMVRMPIELAFDLDKALAPLRG